MDDGQYSILVLLSPLSVRKRMNNSRNYIQENPMKEAVKFKRAYKLAPLKHIHTHKNERRNETGSILANADIGLAFLIKPKQICTFVTSCALGGKNGNTFYLYHVITINPFSIKMIKLRLQWILLPKAMKRVEKKTLEIRHNEIMRLASRSTVYIG